MGQGYDRGGGFIQNGLVWVYQRNGIPAHSVLPRAGAGHPDTRPRRRALAAAPSPERGISDCIKLVKKDHMSYCPNALKAALDTKRGGVGADGDEGGLDKRRRDRVQQRAECAGGEAVHSARGRGSGAGEGRAADGGE